MEKASKTNRISDPEHFDDSIRKFLLNPKKILKEYVKEDMNVLDLGCGPGLFSFEMAKMVGPNGKVIAADVDEEMLERLRNKIKGLEVEKRIRIHKSDRNRFNLNEKFDFILVFYVAHEVKNKKGFFEGLKKLMKPKTKLLIAEPIFHVSKNSFEATLAIAEEVGFKVVHRPKIRMSRGSVIDLRNL